MKKLIIALAALLLPVASIQSAQAQEYNTAIGVNLGADMGFGFKHFLGERGAIEAQFGYNLGCEGVLHLGKHHDSDFAIGLDPTVGFEYKFAGAPIALAVDYKPNINFTPHSQWDLAAFKIRYTF